LNHRLPPEQASWGQDYLLVACADGVIALAQAQAPGKRRQAGAPIARWLYSQGVENLRGQ
jgi:methionyl-tRNA formyltransferase